MPVYAIDATTLDYVETLSKTDINSAIDQKILAAWYVTPAALELNINNINAQVNVIGNNVGTVTAQSANTSIAAVTVNGKSVNVIAVAAGSTTITITEANTGASKTVGVTVSGIIPAATLNNNTPEQIQAAARSGIAQNLWSVGDRIGIAFSGSVGSLILNGTRYAYIIGFNHNSAVEGNNTIHLQIGFSALSSGVNIAYCDSGYGTAATAGFVMNTSATNAGGWAASNMRNVICAAMLQAFPANWQAVISPCVKFTDNAGGGVDNPANVTATADTIFVLSQYEAQGVTGNVNAGEPMAQKQYDYYANGNSKIKYKHNATSTECEWWVRSADVRYSDRFRCIATSGGSNGRAANVSYGFAPAFMVA